jgi:hypothetical protein
MKSLFSYSLLVLFGAGLCLISVSNCSRQRSAGGGIVDNGEKTDPQNPPSEGDPKPQPTPYENHQPGQTPMVAGTLVLDRMLLDLTDYDTVEQRAEQWTMRSRLDSKVFSFLTQSDGCRSLTPVGENNYGVALFSCAEQEWELTTSSGISIYIQGPITESTVHKLHMSARLPKQR